MVDLDADSTGTQSTQSEVEKNRSFSLTSAHISKALRDSSDHGATLIFSRLNLSDVGGSVVEELAAIGGNNMEDQSSVKRYVSKHFTRCTNILDYQNRTRP
jgi:hypothetical protein